MKQLKERRMSVGMILAFLAVGLVAGVASGMFGIGGGAIMVPAMVLILAMTQVEATGTSLGAQILPVGILGALEYYRRGELDVQKSVLIAIGLLIGAYFGARITLSLDQNVVKKAYGVFLLLIGLRYLLGGWIFKQ